MSYRIYHAGPAVLQQPPDAASESVQPTARAMLGECFFILAAALSFALAVNMLLSELGIQ